MTFILSETRDEITTITLNRPDKLNAFSGTMREDLVAALRSAAGLVVVITGAGRAFCAGGDIELMSSLQKNRDVEAFRKLLDAGREVVMQIATMPRPVIASVNGVAAGAGCNLALAWDHRIAAGSATPGGIETGSSARIMTGAPLPSGADAVTAHRKTREAAIEGDLHCRHAAHSATKVIAKPIATMI